MLHGNNTIENVTYGDNADYRKVNSKDHLSNCVSFDKFGENVE